MEFKMSTHEYVGGSPSQQERQVRSKISLACDVCRKRKSRCDGLRPTCTHCANSKVECFYRQTPMVTESDNGLTSRLESVESRLEMLEQRNLSAPPIRASKARHPDDDGAFKRVPMPNYHTGASHKMFQYWPRLRINLALNGFDPLQFQRQCDEADTSLIDGIADAAQSTVRVAIVAEYMRRMYHTTNLVPQTITFFLQMTQTYSLQSALEQIPALPNGDNLAYVKLSELSLTTLLLLSVAFHYLEPDPTTDFATTATSRKCFQLALSRIWTLHSQDEELNLTSKMMIAVQLIIVYGRPFHAFGILRQVGMGLLSPFTRSRLSLGPASFLTKMHFLMESDMLSEIDGQPTADVGQLLFDTSGNVNGSQTQFPLYAAAPEQQAPLFLDQTLCLRLCLNRILANIYMINSAYSNPKFVGRPISDITSELEYWYRSLPIELQFPRTLATYGLLTSSIPSYKVNLATRYYLCHFMLNKGVCYFQLHKEIERLATPPKSPEDQQGMSDLEIWVFECSRTCLHNALLMVACLRSHPQLIGWYQMQMLISCYGVILQCSVQMPTIFGDFEDPDETLNSIEFQLESVAEQTRGSRWTIDMLRNVRHNLYASSPHSNLKQTPGSGNSAQTPSTGGGP